MPSQTLPAPPASAPGAQLRPRPPQTAPAREDEDFAQCLAAEEKAGGLRPDEKIQPRNPAAGAADAAEKAETGPEAEGQLPAQQLLPPETATPLQPIASVAPSSMSAADAQLPGSMPAAETTAPAGIGAARGGTAGSMPAAHAPDRATGRETQHAAAADAPATTVQPQVSPQRQPVENAAGNPAFAALLASPAIAAQPVAASQPAPAAVPTTTTATPEALPMTIAAAAQGDIKVMVIRLDPADLGNVQLRLELGEDGLRRAHLIVERPATLHQLMQDAPRLEQALASTGSGGADISFSLRQEASYPPGPDQRQNTGNGPAHGSQPGADAEGTPEQPSAPLAYRRSATAAAHLDMLA